MNISLILIIHFTSRVNQITEIKLQYSGNIVILDGAAHLSTKISSAVRKLHECILEHNLTATDIFY